MERGNGTECKQFPSHGGKSLFTVAAIRKKHLQKEMNVVNVTSSSYVKSKKRNRFQEELLTEDYIANNIFRKDGPVLGHDFDFLPSGPKVYAPACPENLINTKRKKVYKSAIVSHPDCNMEVPVKKHGVGKGLMTVWMATNPDGRDLPIGYGLVDQEVRLASNSILHKPVCDNKRSRKTVTMNGMLKNKLQSKRNKLQDKRHFDIQRRPGESNQYVSEIQLPKEKCDLALNSAISAERLDRVSMLIDDEELEMRDLEAGTDLLMCSDHLATSGILGCSLCKDVLVKFPPDTVKMKKPICLQPWDSSPEIVKKLFKVHITNHL